MLRRVTDTAPSDEVARLKDEVEKLQSKLDRRERWRLRGRRAALAFLLVLGCGLVVASLVAAYTRAIGPEHRPLRRDDGADRGEPRRPGTPWCRSSTRRSRTGSTSRGWCARRSPTRRIPLAPVLGEGLRSAIRSRLDEFVALGHASRALERGQPARALARVALLTTGESRRLLLEEDTVYLDLGPAVDRVREGLQERGLERLAAAIPAGVDGRITLLQSEGFVKARGAIDLLESLTIILPILALLCLGGHVALSRPRRRGLLRVGLGLIVTALLLLALVGLARSAYLDAIDRDVLPRQAAADIFDALIGLLRGGLRVVAICAVVLALLALVLGRTEQITAHSRSAVRGLAASPRIGWVARHRALLQGARRGARGTRPVLVGPADGGSC